MDSENIVVEKGGSNNKDCHSKFKKPLALVGKISKLPHKAAPITDNEQSHIETKSEDNKRSYNASTDHPRPQLTEVCSPLFYKEPKWSAVPAKETQYKLEVLKSGSIVEVIDLTTKSFFVFGRLPTCDIVMAHPTISRYHMVLQYKAVETEDHPCGFYMFDLDSTHGSFLNKIVLKPHHYVRVMVGHIFKLGASSRNFILQGPEVDQEEETELSVTELKLQKSEELKERKRKADEVKTEQDRLRLEEERKTEEAGISWGMDDDAEEESDLSENPYATTSNEELYLDDPKKTLRGFFEREGAILEYDCEERGIGQFVCRVELPIDDAKGRPIVAEVIHKGKKKEAVVQCALEACRVIDRHGLLRQARHESRKRKQKDWKSEDFYDSDDDTFLDRTGKVEEKRNKRMVKYGGRESDKADKSNNDVQTYDDLVERVAAMKREINEKEVKLSTLRVTLKADQNQNSNKDVDDLDAYMAVLSKGTGGSMAQKAEISKIKLEIQSLKMDMFKTERLAEIARPASLPELVKPLPNAKDSEPTIRVKKTSNAVMYGKRIKLKYIANKDKQKMNKLNSDDNFVEEVESDEETPGGENRLSYEDESAIESESRLETNAEVENKNRVEGNYEIEKKDKLSTGNSKHEEDGNMNAVINEKTQTKDRVFGPMRPPTNYVVPENYFEQESDRDLPEFHENSNIL